MKRIYKTSDHRFVSVFSDQLTPPMVVINGQPCLSTDVDDVDIAGHSVGYYFDQDNEEKSAKTRELIEEINKYLGE